MRNAVVQIALSCCLLMADSAVAGPIVTHIYDLDGTYADALGGPALTPNGGTLGASGYTFGFGEGPSLGGVVNPADYSIELLFRIDDHSGFRKIVDFKDLASDFGLYNLDGKLTFYDVSTKATPPVPIGNDTVIHLVLTRDSATGQFSAYLNGQVQLTFQDSSGFATFDGPGNVIHLLRDDGPEHPSGFLDRVRIYDGVLSREDIVSLFNGEPPPGLSQVPEPASGTLLGMGFAGVCAWRQRRARSLARVRVTE
jgi:hypothetical protein